MVKLKAPLLSFLARGKLGNITFLRRRHTDIAEETPVPHDAKSTGQLSWRTMYQACTDLWHTLSAAEKRAWESAGSIRHMTGYAWYLSQCLRPNPGIYLPLAGGTMTGAIQMDGEHIHGLPLPVHVQDVWRRQDFQDFCLPFHMVQGARARHNVDQAIANDTWQALALNTERYDNDAIHDNVVNNSRLTCKTAGKYLIAATISFEPDNVGNRGLRVRFGGVSTICELFIDHTGGGTCNLCVATIWDMSVGEYVEAFVYQISGGALDVKVRAAYSPEFMMQRIGS